VYRVRLKNVMSINCIYASFTHKKSDHQKAIAVIHKRGSKNEHQYKINTDFP
jgi:hypothetical protein